MCMHVFAYIDHVYTYPSVQIIHEIDKFSELGASGGLPASANRIRQDRNHFEGK